MARLGWCVTVGRHPDNVIKFPSGTVVPLWCVKIYKAEARRKDNKYTWRLHKACDPVSRFKLPPSLVEEGKALANRLDMEFKTGVKQGGELTLSDLEILALQGRKEEL